MTVTFDANLIRSFLSKDYVEQRRIFYYASSIVTMSSYYGTRAAAVSKIYRQLAFISQRILKLKVVAAQVSSLFYKMFHSHSMNL